MTPAPEGFELASVQVYLASEGTMRHILPPDAAEWFMRANQHLRARELDEAERGFRVVLRRAPDCALAHHLLAQALRYGKHPELAVHPASQAVRLAADSYEARCALGDILAELQHVEAALAVYTEAVTRWPDVPRAHWSRSGPLLVLGRFGEGWPEREWRLKDDLAYPEARRYPEATRWDGAPLGGRTVLLWYEGGYGDTLQFIRYAPLVAARGGRVVLEVQPELVRLLDGFPGVTAICTRGHAPPPFDTHASLLSLPALFGTTLETIPPAPYLQAPFEAALDSSGHASLRVGIVWAGGATNVADELRSTALTAWKAVLEVPGVTLVSLQVGPAAGQLAESPFPIFDAASLVHDFADTAIQLRHLDLVISVDTAVAHLAGAMGRPTWVLLARCHDSRWLLDRDDSPWYPTMRLFRQRRGDWAEVFRRVAEELAAWVGDHSPITLEDSHASD